MLPGEEKTKGEWGLQVLYEIAFKPSLCWLRRRLLDVLPCTPASPPPCRLVIILNANPY